MHAGACLGLAFAIAAPAAHAAGTIDFAPVATYLLPDVGVNPHETSVVAADFNVDGHPDIALVTYDDVFLPRVFVLLNRGDGTFGANPLQIIFSAHAQFVPPLSGTLLARDIDGDGKIDLVVASHFEVTVLLGNGDGTFTKKAQFAQVPHIGQLDAALADVNNDGKLDLMVTATLGIQTFLGNDDGTFDTTLRYSVVKNPWGFPNFAMSGFAVANLNNDGIPDLLVADAATQRVYSLLGDGSGRFTQGSYFSSGLIPGGVVAGDFNEDGTDDAVVFNEFNWIRPPQKPSLELAVSNGAGGFGATSYADGGLAPISGTIGDIDGDGHLDVVSSDTVGSLGAIVILRGDGAGHLLPAGRFNTPFFQQTPVVADFDGDGRPDIATAGFSGLSAVYVLLNRTQ